MIIVIFDLKGKALRRENISFEGNLTIDIDDLDPGIYTLKLSGDDFIWIKKLVKF